MIIQSKKNLYLSIKVIGIEKNRELLKIIDECKPELLQSSGEEFRVRARFDGVQILNTET